MEFREMMNLMFPSLIAILGFICLKFYQKWHEGESIKDEIHNVANDLKHFKDSSFLKFSTLENSLSTERQERIQMITAVENRIYDFLNDFKKDVKEDIKDLSIKLEQNTKKEEDWRMAVSNQLSNLIIHKASHDK